MKSPIYSMTGFGKGQVSFGNKSVIAEIRSLNSQRGADISLKFSTSVREQEQLLRSMVAEHLRRGKIDVYVTIEKEDHIPDSLLNRKLIKAYYTELQSIAQELGASQEGLLPAILRIPDVMSVGGETNEGEWQAVQDAVLLSIEALKKYRADEGRTTATDMLLRIDLIEQYAGEIKALDPGRIADIRTRLQTNVYATIGGKEKLDPNRLEQEMVYYIEKLDITEELTRLQSHCDYYREVVNGQDEDKGRKLNFIAQEIGREINTLGSKAQHAPMQKYVVRMKDELEKIKEQVNNIL